MTGGGAMARRLFRPLAVVCLTLAFVIVPFLVLGPWLESQALGRMAGLEGVGLALGSAALLALDVVLPVPSSIVAITTGALLGRPLGALVVWSGMSIGCVLGFYIGRGAEPVAKAVGGPAGHEALTAFMRRWGWYGLIVLRPVPVLAEGSLLMASACGLGLRTTLAATLPANLGIAALYAHVGAQALGSAPIGLPILVSFGAPALLAIVFRVAAAPRSRR
jgi:uncharacterized membrane protein YdjX (TVP38/TMEM64 family)